MKRYRITIDCTVHAKTERKADKLLERMLDAIQDSFVASTATIEEEATDE